MKCFFGHTFGKNDNGYQYCKNCGKARFLKCNHKFVEYSVSTVTTYVGFTQKLRNLQCKFCGKMEQFNLTTGNYE